MDDMRKVILSVGAVVFKGSDVLLIQRGKAPFEGHWSIPGGKVEYGEALEVALAREVREETGIEIKVLGLIDVFESVPQRFADPHFVMVDYVAEFVSGEVQAADDAMDAAFLPYPEALSRLAWDKTRRALQQAKSALNQLRQKTKEEA